MAHLHQPLLHVTAGESHAAPLLHSGVRYEYRHRPAQDVLWARCYQLLLTASAVVGVLAVINQTVPYTSVFDRDAFLRDPSNCPAQPPGSSQHLVDFQQQAPGAGALAPGLHTQRAASVAPFLQSAGLLLLGSLAAALTASCGFLLLVQHWPGTLVAASVVLQVLIPAGGGLWALTHGNMQAAAWGLGVALCLAIMFCWGRPGLEQVAQLLGVSAQATRDQPGMLLVGVLLNLLLPVVVLAFGWATAAAAANGTVEASPHRYIIHGEYCVNKAMEQVDCCVFQPAPWATAYCVLAATTLVWTVLLMNGVKVFTVAGTVSQWYWSSDTTSSIASTRRSVRGATLRSLRHALGPSLGTLCVGSLCLMLTSWIRGLVQRGHRGQSQQRSLVSALLAGTLGCVVQVLQQLTKFSVVRAAMTGSAFWPAGQDVVQLLKRNAMDAYNVWWYPPVVLHLAAGWLAALLSWATYRVAYVLWSGAGSLPGSLDAGTAARTLALLTGLWSFAMMSFLSGVLLHVVDTLFVCVAVDREHHTCGRPAVHQVYAHLPSVGKLVVQPWDTQYAYADAPPLADDVPPLHHHHQHHVHMHSGGSHVGEPALHTAADQPALGVWAQTVPQPQPVPHYPVVLPAGVAGNPNNDPQ